MAQWVKDPASLPQWLGSLLWHRFDSWPGNFHMTWMQPKKKKKSMAFAQACSLPPSLRAGPEANGRMPWTLVRLVAEGHSQRS